MKGLFVFWVWTLLYLSWGSSVMSLEGMFGNEGVCKEDKKVTKSKPVKVYVTHTRVVPVSCGFRDNLMNRGKNCEKTVTAGEWVQQPDVTWEETVTTEYCCEGYSQQNDRCVPQCTSGCTNGICRHPDHCICVGGYLKKQGSEECEPHCSKPCGENQFCSRPNECSCIGGFELDGEDSSKCIVSKKLCNVHCEHGYCPEPSVCICLDGYFLHTFEQTQDSRCDPICEKECVNATCTAPNKCTCLDGYTSIEENVCSPNVCEKPCVNGYCSSNGKCECKRGYKQIDNDPNKCEPVCSKPCENGICINPEECTCLTNYVISEEDHYVCKPICKNGCVNGECTLPDVCTCKDGYKKEKENICDPVCDEVCFNGFCSAPNTCSCLEGYENDPLKPLSCRPICSKPCLNATCTAPETCNCYSGYEKVTNDDFRCLPVCHEKCINSECSDPEVCSCIEGYVKDVERPNVCVAFCSKGCRNGHCEAPETCSCDSGFKASAEDDSICEPECSQECINGFCSSPGVCSCNEGYQVDDNDKNRCNPVCKQECVHGTCSAPDKCSCNVGYDETDDPYVCSPHCAKACINGDCTAPNLCECYPNHSKDEKDPHICNASCEDECMNGYCQSMNVCGCREGFVATDNPNVCKPMCFSCTNGVCESPDICKCDEGFKNLPGRQDICVPICEKECLNGGCVKPNVCGCFKGYKMIDGTCQPHCSRCEKGKCVAPNKCNCYPGYKNTKGSHGCEAVCKEECINGVCISPNECSCLWGFDPTEEDNKCQSNPVGDPYFCIFQDNFLSRKKGDICFTQELEIKLTNLDECFFIMSLILRYLQETDKYEVTLNCLLNYFSDDEKDPTLFIECSTQNVINLNDQLQEDDFFEEKNETDHDLIGTKWMSKQGEDGEGNVDTLEDLNSKYFESVDQDDESNESVENESESKEEVKPSKGVPVIFLPPLLPTIVTYAAKPVEPETSGSLEKKKEGRTIQDLLQTPTPIIDELDKMKPDNEDKMGLIPSIRKALREIRKDVGNLREEIKEMDRKEKEEKKAMKIANKKAEDEGEENESESNETIKGATDELDTSKKEFILRMHNVPKNMTDFPLITKINHLSYIIKEKITDAVFEDITDSQILSEWCLCVKNEDAMCLDGKFFKMILCPCKPLPTTPSVVKAYASKVIYWTIAFGLAVLQICIVIFLVRFCCKWRRQRKIAATREQQRKDTNTHSSVNSLQVRVNVENVNPENAETSSKL